MVFPILAVIAIAAPLVAAGGGAPGATSQERAASDLGSESPRDGAGIPHAGTPGREESSDGGGAALLPIVAIAGFEMAPDGDARDEWMATAIEEGLSRRLRRVTGMSVVSPARIYQLRRELLDSRSSSRDWSAVAGHLGATRLLTGVCSGPPDAAVIRLRMAACGEAMGTPEITIGPARIFGAMNEAAARAEEWLGVPDSERTDPSLVDSPTESVAALEYHARAVQALRARKPVDAQHFARESIESDGRFRPAVLLLTELDLARGAEGLSAATASAQMLAQLARVFRDPVDRAWAELALGRLSSTTGAWEAAMSRCENALALSFAQGDLRAQLDAMNAIRDAYLLRQPPPELAQDAAMRRGLERRWLERARQWQSIALDLAVRMGDAVEELQASNRLAQICDRLGDAEQAEACHRRTLAIAAQLGSRSNLTAAHMFLAQWYRDRQRWDEALASANECLSLVSPEGVATVRILIGDIYRAMSAPEAALQEFEKARAQVVRGDDLATQFVCLSQIAALQNQLGRRRDAVETLRAAIDLAHALELPEEARLRRQLAEWEQMR
jgi:tetratricopeptide (TPR) repeat protein